MVEKNRYRGGAIKAFGLLLLLVVSHTVLSANVCAKWFPMPAFNSMVVVLPIYDANMTEPDLDCDGIADSVDPDIDGDGVPNAHDAFPMDDTESVDTDGDGIGNNADLDDDNDGYSDTEEIAFGSDPLDANSIPVVVSNDGFVVSPLRGTSSQVSFAIALRHKPESNVTIIYHSEDETVAKPQKEHITFTPENWYRSQLVIVDIYEPQSSTEITFDPTVSDDAAYRNRVLEPVSIVSHQLKLFEPVDKIVYSEFNMSIPVGMAYVGDREANITVTLDAAPVGMKLDVDTGKLLWKPSVSEEGEDKTVTLTASDGTINDTKTFILHVAHPIPLATAVVDGKLVITDTNATLKGLSIEPLDGAVLSEYRLYRLPVDDVPALSEGERAVGERLLVKGNVGKKVKVRVPLHGLVATNELLTFHTKSYFGEGNWRRIDYDYDFNGTVDAPVYELTTKALFGVMAFTVKTQNQQQKTSKNRSQLKSVALQKSTSSIHCVPQTWSFLNLTDYDNQLCTFDDKPDFTLQVFNYPDTDISDITPIEEMASWVIKAQDKLIELGMPYRNYSAFSFQDDFAESHGETATYNKVKGSLFIDYPTIYNFSLSLIHTYLGYRATQITIYHEYFHQSQSLISNNTLNKPRAKWLIESGAVWFSDYADGNSGYVYMNLLPTGSDRRIFRDAIFDVSNIVFTGGRGFGQSGVTHKGSNSEYYDRSLFLEMVENYCPNFTNYIPYLFQKDINDPTSLQHLTNVINASNCNFGSSPTGQGNESRIETAILLYQYISDIKHLDNLINPNINVGKLGFADGTPYDFSSDEFMNLTLNDYHVKRYFSGLSKDTQARTAHIPKINSSLPRCQERYIRIKSEKTILVSLASSDTDFPDTPNTMLGDMKQINFGMVGKIDFTYFYSPTTGKQVYPEIYLTITDVVDDTSTLTPQNIEIGMGLRRNNLLSHIDGKDMCAEYVPAINQTTVTADGVIPSQYRDNSDISNYIDRIKITCLESGEVFNATVNPDGSWSTNIHITFNGNESRFSIEGYNASNTQRIIAYQGLVVEK
jgi:hypothetical protein